MSPLRRSHRLLCEDLERRLLAAAALDAPYPTTPAAGYSASQVRTAYGVNAMSLTGQGQRIVIVDAGLSPTLLADVTTFDAVEGLPPIHLQTTQTGPLSTPADGLDPGWYVEETLDVEWAHAIAPGAQIVVCACSTATLFDLGAGAAWAGKEPNVAAVSLSWGAAGDGNPFGDYLYLDATANRTVVLASSGDQGGVITWPGASPATIGVGGTSLQLGAGGSYEGETGWSGSGGGPSTQKGVRSPLVSWDADPATGVQVWCTSYRPGRGWYEVGGTSVSAPSWAGVIALTDQQRVTLGEPILTTPQARDMAGAIPYALCYHDITVGSAGGNTAGKGFDYVTGLGSPRADQWVGYASRYVRPWKPIPVQPFAHASHPAPAAEQIDVYRTLEVR